VEKYEEFVKNNKKNRNSQSHKKITNKEGKGAIDSRLRVQEVHTQQYSRTIREAIVVHTASKETTNKLLESRKNRYTISK